MMDGSGTEDDEHRGPSRKRFRKNDERARNVRKGLRLLGKAYVSKNGRSIPPRSIGEDCRCPRHCFESVYR